MKLRPLVNELMDRVGAMTRADLRRLTDDEFAALTDELLGADAGAHLRDAIRSLPDDELRRVLELDDAGQHDQVADELERLIATRPPRGVCLTEGRDTRA